MTRKDAIMEGAAYWGSFYRENPEKFVQDYLHIELRRFQKILLVMMFWSVSFVFIACRGIGKTYLSAIYCVTRSILYPGSKTAIAAQTRGQACQVLSKILYELKPKSPELCAEIDERKSQINGTNAIIVFKNTSTIEVVTAADSARGHRASILLLDECRLLNKDTIDTILKKFLNFRRLPDYKELTLEERKAEYAKEKNITLWLTSAHFKDSWAYQKCVDTFDSMIRRGRHEFVCGFPYQLSIEEGFLDPESVVGDFLESSFSEIKWGINISVPVKPIEPVACGGTVYFSANRGSLSALAYGYPVPSCVYNEMASILYIIMTQKVQRPSKTYLNRYRSRVRQR